MLLSIIIIIIIIIINKPARSMLGLEELAVALAERHSIS